MWRDRMYSGQITLAFSVAAGLSYIVWSQGQTVVTALLLGIVTYLLLRWMLTWVARIRYWYPNDGYESRSCPECGQFIHRLKGDWIMSCRRCGWTAGFPVVRWFTHSLPSVQLRRTVVGPGLLVLAISVLLIASGASAQITMNSVDFPDGIADDDEPSPSAPLTEDRTNLTNSEQQPGYDFRQVESEFIARLNEERSDRGLQELRQRDVLTEMGHEHSANMAEHDYIGHEWPDGTTIADRYRERGLLPECRLPVQGTNEFYRGAENAGQTWVGQNLITDSNVTYIDSDEDLATHLFEMWMNSEGHREAMLVASADEAGLGLNISSDGKVYSALELC